jgi:hypothetical protein
MIETPGINQASTMAYMLTRPPMMKTHERNHGGSMVNMLTHYTQKQDDLWDRNGPARSQTIRLHNQAEPLTKKKHDWIQDSNHGKKSGRSRKSNEPGCNRRTIQEYISMVPEDQRSRQASVEAQTRWQMKEHMEWSLICRKNQDLRRSGDDPISTLLWKQSFCVEVFRSQLQTQFFIPPTRPGVRSSLTSLISFSI